MSAALVRNVFMALVLLVAIADGAQGAASPWTARDAGMTANLWGVAAGGGRGMDPTKSRIVAVGEQGTILTSVNGGNTWTRAGSGTTAWLTAVTYAYGPDRFFAVGEGGIILSSGDGAVWSRESSPTNARLNVVAADPGGGSVYAAGEAGAGWLTRDGNGDWTRTDPGWGNAWLRGMTAAYGVVTVGQGGAVYSRSSAGVSPTQTEIWTRQTVPVAVDLEALVYGPPEGGFGTSLVVVGAGGTILQQEGASWSVRSSGTTQRLRGICRKEGGGLVLITLTLRIALGEYIAVGTGGTVLRSTGGAAWQVDPTPTARNLNAVAADNISNVVVAVGDGGTILTTGGVAAGPTIARQPTIGLDAADQPFLEGEGSGDGALTHLWVRVSGGAPWPVGYEHPRQTVARALFGPLHLYQLIVANAFGFTRSELVAPNRLLDLSGRAVVGAGENMLIGGFAVGGDELPRKRTVLIRAVGPTLADLGVSAPLRAPRLSVFDGARVIATNNGWESNANAEDIRAATARLGTFQLRTGSTDSALLLQLEPGNYTAQVESADGTSGVALVEVYDADGVDFMHLKNLSARARVQGGDGVLIGGLVISGGVPKQVLLRGAGPALAALGVGGVLIRPRLTLFQGQTVVATNAGWGGNANAAEIAGKAEAVGAFAFAEGSADAALLLTLNPGVYTIHVAGADDGSGVALVEVYEAP